MYLFNALFLDIRVRLWEVWQANEMRFISCAYLHAYLQHSATVGLYRGRLRNFTGLA